MSTKNRKQIIESVKTHNKVLVKNLLLEKASPTALGTVQNVADMGALVSGLLGGGLLFVPGLQPVGAGLLAMSRTAGAVGAGAGALRWADRQFNPDSHEVLPAGALLTGALISGAGGIASKSALKAAKNVDTQINKVVDFRNNLQRNRTAAAQAEIDAIDNYNTLTNQQASKYQIDRAAKEIDAARDAIKKYTPDPTTGLAPIDPGLLTSNNAKANAGIWSRTTSVTGDPIRSLIGSSELTDLNRINAFVNARGGVIKSKNQLGNLEFIPGGSETGKRIARTVGLPNVVNLVRPQGMIGQVKEGDPNYNQSVFGRAALGPDTFNPLGRSSLSTRYRVRPAPGILSPQELVGQEQQYPSSSLLNAWYALRGGGINF